MVNKVSQDGRPYGIDGKALLWQPEDDSGERGNLPDIRIPFRLKLNTVLSLGEADLDLSSMRVLLERIIPGQMDAVGEMDINDFQDMFTTWQSEYNSLTGGSLGESSQPAVSSPSIVAPSSTTSADSASPSPTLVAPGAEGSPGARLPVS